MKREYLKILSLLLICAVLLPYISPIKDIYADENTGEGFTLTLQNGINDLEAFIKSSTQGVRPKGIFKISYPGYEKTLVAGGETFLGNDIDIDKKIPKGTKVKFEVLDHNKGRKLKWKLTNIARVGLSESEAENRTVEAINAQSVNTIYFTMPDKDVVIDVDEVNDKIRFYQTQDAPAEMEKIVIKNKIPVDLDGFVWVHNETSSPRQNAKIAQRKSRNNEVFKLEEEKAVATKNRENSSLSTSFTVKDKDGNFAICKVEVEYETKNLGLTDAVAKVEGKEITHPIAGEIVTIEAKKKDNQHFKAWSSDDDSIDDLKVQGSDQQVKDNTQSKLSFVMPNKDLKIKANYIPTYKVTTLLGASAKAKKHLGKEQNPQIDVVEDSTEFIKDDEIVIEPSEPDEFASWNLISGVEKVNSSDPDSAKKLTVKVTGNENIEISAVKLPPVPTPNATFDTSTMLLSNFGGQKIEYALDRGAADREWIAVGNVDSVKIEITEPTTIYVVARGDKQNTRDSEVQTIRIERAQKPTPMYKDEMSIRDVNDTMEYKKSSEKDWTAVPSGQTEITGLETRATYYVRVKAFQHKLASEHEEIKMYPNRKTQADEVNLGNLLTERTYTGQEIVICPEDSDKYTLSGEYKATETGEYRFTVTLKNGKIWADTLTDEARTVNWKILKANRNTKPTDVVVVAPTSLKNDDGSIKAAEKNIEASEDKHFGVQSTVFKSGEESNVITGLAGGKRYYVRFAQDKNYHAGEAIEQSILIPNYQPKEYNVNISADVLQKVNVVLSPSHPQNKVREGEKFKIKMTSKRADKVIAKITYSIAAADTTVNYSESGVELTMPGSDLLIKSVEMKDKPVSAEPPSSSGSSSGNSNHSGTNRAEKIKPKKENSKKKIEPKKELPSPDSNGKTSVMIGEKKIEEVFQDVKQDDWFASSIAFAKEKNWMSGTSERDFSPNQKTNRAMLVTILYRLDGMPEAKSTSTFKDVKQGEWFADAITWASENKIVSGYGNGNFGSKDEVTREQVAVILYHYAKNKNLNLSSESQTLSFKDTGAISDYALDAMKWANKIGLIKGKGSVLDPKGTTTRAEVAAIMMRFYQHFYK